MPCEICEYNTADIAVNINGVETLICHKCSNKIDNYTYLGEIDQKLF